jgi:mRNA interferase RelE/StbE
MSIALNARASGNEISDYRTEIGSKGFGSVAGYDGSACVEALSTLEIQPRPPGCKKLRGEKAWRIRIGDYRVIYEIHDKVLQIVLIIVGHRREVYK